MAKRNDPNIIDGFASVQALKHATARKKAGTASKKPPRKEVALSPAPAPQKPAVRTIVPQKRLVICYSCKYSHTVSGRMHNPFCPKCKTKLNIDNVVVDGKHIEDILTIGNVEIKPDAEFSDGLSITGQRIAIDGDVTNIESITASEALIIRSNAKFKSSSINNVSGLVIIPSECNVKTGSQLCCNIIEISGTIDADIVVEKSATVHKGAMLKGSFSGPSLIVEDGGGLSGNINLKPLQQN
jgi:cytoskeletal protein CcmA (bactofilin family)